MPLRGGTLHSPADLKAGADPHPSTRLPLVVYVLALATFLMGTTEFVVAGLLPEPDRPGTRASRRPTSSASLGRVPSERGSSPP
jgi:hypothetical protein